MLLFLILFFVVVAIVSTLIYTQICPEHPNKWIHWGFGLSAYALLMGLFLLALHSSPERDAVMAVEQSPTEKTIDNAAAGINLMLALVFFAVLSCEYRLKEIRNLLHVQEFKKATSLPVLEPMTSDISETQN